MKKRMLCSKPISTESYHHGNNEYGLITGIYDCNPNEQGWRLCYEITYSNGLKDYVPITDYTCNVNKLISLDTYEEITY
jgi:hypothetical protein